MAETTLEMEKRTDMGKKATKALRNAGRVPAVYYIHNQDSVPLSVDEKALREVIHGDSNVLELKIKGSKGLKTIIRDIQWDPVTGQPLHVDFLGIKSGERLTVDVPLHVTGTPIGVKQDGGIMQQILRELSIECLPRDIPEHLEVDVSNLEIGDSLHISDIVAENVTFNHEETQTIVVVRPPSLAIEDEEEDTDEEEMLEPEVLSDRKAGEEDEEETEES